MGAMEPRSDGERPSGLLLLVFDWNHQQLLLRPVMSWRFTGRLPRPSTLSLRCRFGPRFVADFRRGP